MGKKPGLKLHSSSFFTRTCNTQHLLARWISTALVRACFSFTRRQTQLASYASGRSTCKRHHTIQFILGDKMDGCESRVVSQPLPSGTLGPPIYPHLDHHSLSQERPEFNLESAHTFGIPIPMGSAVGGSSMPLWPSMLGSQQKSVRQIQARALPRLPMRLSAKSSRSTRTLRKPLTTEAREGLRKFAEANPSTTHQDIASSYTYRT